MKPYGKNITPDCRYCFFSREDKECIKKAEKKGNTSCHYFEYDPLLRKPRKTPSLPVFSADDFML